MKVIEIWDDIENTRVLENTIFKRYSSNVKPDIFLGVNFFQKSYFLMIFISSEFKINLKPYLYFQDLSIIRQKDNHQKDKDFFVIQLNNIENKEIFAVLIEDLIENVKDETIEKNVVNFILNRLFNWNTLFLKNKQSELSNEDQRGLFGELHLILIMLNHFHDSYNIINSWIGPNKEAKDFQLFDWAIEVKTTYGKNHQKILINSERQLDETHIESLFLYHLSLEKTNENGITLNNLIDEIKEYLVDQRTMNLFNVKLLEYGYYEKDFNKYENIGYFLRQENIYKVLNEFPRIREKDLLSGIGDVSYSIIVGGFENYIITKQELLDKIKFN